MVQFNIHDVGWGPKNAVAMRVLARIEPHPVPLLPPTRHASVAVHVGLKSPRLPFHIS